MTTQTINWKNYRIDVDEFQWILVETVETKKPTNAKMLKGWHPGKTKDVVHGYYSSFDNCMKTLLRIESLKQGNTFTLVEYIKMWKALSDQMKTDLAKMFVSQYT